MPRTAALALALACIVTGCVAAPGAQVEQASTASAAIPASLAAGGATIEPVIGGVLPKIPVG